MFLRPRGWKILAGSVSPFENFDQKSQLFLKKKIGPTPPLFSLFLSFETNITILSTIKMSIHYSAPGFELTTFWYDSPPLTTRPAPAIKSQLLIQINIVIPANSKLFIYNGPFRRTFNCLLKVNNFCNKIDCGSVQTPGPLVSEVTTLPCMDLCSYRGGVATYHRPLSTKS